MNQSKISHKKLLSIVSDFYNISEETLKSRTREREIVKARQMFWLLASVFCGGLTSHKLGTLLNRDHTTVLHGIKKMREEIEMYSDYKEDYRYFSEKIDGRFIPKNRIIYCNTCIYEAA